MAIQKINLGTEPLGEGGDTYRSANTKINENFTNTDHAASRLVGVGEKDLLEASQTGIGLTTAPVGTNFDTQARYKTSAKNIKHLERITFGNEGLMGYPRGVHFHLSTKTTMALMSGIVSPHKGRIRVVLVEDADTGTPIEKTGSMLVENITAFADSNGVWKTSSPVVRVYANEIDPNDDAKKQGVTFTRNSVGNYTLHNTLGLAQEGWTITLPEDDNRNPLVAIETEYKNGDLNIRTYKRIFSMETFTFTCDYKNPLDIPEGRCVDIRLHEILPDTTNKIIPETESK